MMQDDIPTSVEGELNLARYHDEQYPTVNYPEMPASIANWSGAPPARWDENTEYKMEG